MEKYKIGEHEFESKEEWENALKDLKQIRDLVEQLDVDDPEDTLVLYQLLRNGDITFSSQLGDAFFCDISDRVAANSKKMLEKGGMGRNLFAEIKRKVLMLFDNDDEEAPFEKEHLFKMVGIVCVVLAVLCFIVYGLSVYAEKRATRKLEEVQELKSITQAVNWYMERIQQSGDDDGGAVVGNPQQEQPTAQEPAVPQVLPEYASLYQQYPDLIGWVNVEGTSINLPVMQGTSNDDYYLHHNIDGEEDINGTLFMDYRDDIINHSKNYLVYGHNMRSGAMFGTLKQYLDDAFLVKHKQILFDTIYEKGTYEVIAVCLTEVGYQDENTYRYYNFINPANTDEFNAYFDSIRECAVYDNTQGVTEADQFLTLSTCNSYTEDGRLFVVAKKIQ